MTGDDTGWDELSIWGRIAVATILALIFAAVVIAGFSIIIMLIRGLGRLLVL